MVKTKDYYTSQKSEFFTQFDGFCERVGALIEEKYGKKFKNDVMGEIKRGFELIFDEIPYIGGDDNFLTMDLVSAAQALALYQVLKRYDKPVEEIGEIAYQESEQYLRDNADLIPPMTHPKYVFYIEMAAKGSLEREYSGDWAYEFIPGDGENDYGLDFIECGIQKLFHEHDADEFTPYLCAMDIPMSECGNLGLHRTQTLAEGGDRCDFRYKGGRKTEVASTVIKKG